MLWLFHIFDLFLSPWIRIRILNLYQDPEDLWIRIRNTALNPDLVLNKNTFEEELKKQCHGAAKGKSFIAALLYNIN